MAPVAMTFAVLEKGYGAGGISLVMAAETLALVLLLLFAGVLADRFPRKLNMLGSNASSRLFPGRPRDTVAYRPPAAPGHRRRRGGARPL